jgi:hypothetical protein
MRMDIFDVDHGACAVLEAPAFASRSTPPPALETAPAPACSQGSGALEPPGRERALARASQ